MLQQILVQYIFFLFSFNYIHCQAEDLNDGRIVNGTFQPITLRPYQALVFTETGSPDKFCGGSVLNHRWILTAAHCFKKDHNVHSISIGVGLQKITLKGQEDIYDAETFIIHPQYDPVTFDNDIALVKTKLAIEFTRRIDKVEINPTEPKKRDFVKVSGYGREEYQGTITDKLMSTELRVVDFISCNQSVYRALTYNMFCAAGPMFYTDACQGDSGGPVTLKEKLVGIVSFGKECAKKNAPGVYTKVANYIDWIQETQDDYDNKFPSDDIYSESTYSSDWWLYGYMNQE